MKEDGLRLVFHFWDGGDDVITKLHFKMLSIYAHLFDEVIFVISTDNMDDENHIQDIRHRIIDIGFKGKLTIIVEPNNRVLRESLTYKKYIIDKLDALDGLTLFAHSRGGSVDYVEPIYLYNLIIFLYYGCLNWIDEVKGILLDNPKYVAYGGIQIKSDNGNDKYPFSKNKWWYQGSFHWLNTKKIIQHIENIGVKMPKLTDRYYAENGFLPNMFTEEHAFNHSGDVIINPTGAYYNDTLELIEKTIANRDGFENYMFFSNNIIKELE